MTNDDPATNRKPDAPDAAKIGRIAALSGGAAALVGGFLLATLCCLAPALIVALGIGSFYAAAYGYRYLLLGLGAAMVGTGLFWAWRKRKADECPCGPEGEANA